MEDKVEEIISLFDIDKETAKRILAYINPLAQEKFEKWRKNFKKVQKQKADEIYNMFKELRNTRDFNAKLEEIKKKVLELAVE